jgi:hypothetical protein
VSYLQFTELLLTCLHPPLVPPYRPSDFENSHIKYIKLSTVSKIPPTKDDVATFVDLASDCWNEKRDMQIAVHCHYGLVAVHQIIIVVFLSLMNVLLATDSTEQDSSYAVI